MLRVARHCAVGVKDRVDNASPDDTRPDVHSAVSVKIGRTLRRMSDVERRGYTVAQAAEYLGISDWVLRNEMRNNRIAAKKRGSTILFDRNELDRYFDSLPER